MLQLFGICGGWLVQGFGSRAKHKCLGHLFLQSKLTGIKEVRGKAPDKPGGYDKIVVQDANAPPLWARFYDIQKNTPIFCSRDGIPRKTMAEISHERRNNYSWLGAFARDLFAKDLPAWKKRLERNEK